MSEQTDGLSALLERVERTVGPDRELDALIMCALVVGPGAYVEQSKINDAWCIYYAPNRIWSMSSRAGTWREGGWPLTASLDAALALVERVLPGWGGQISLGQPPWAWVTSPDYEEPEDFVESKGAVFTSGDYGKPPAKTPTLALLAAMLKALIAQTKADQG